MVGAGGDRRSHADGGADTSIINLTLPKAQAALGMSDATRGWVVTAYTLTFGGLLLLGGRVAGLLGRRRVFLIGLIRFAAASALGGIAPTAEVLFAARALQGVFAALLAAAGSTTLEAHLTGYRIAFTVAAVFFAAALLVITLATHQARRPRPTSATAAVHNPPP